MYSHNLLLERILRTLVDGLAVFVSALTAVLIGQTMGWIPPSSVGPPSIYIFPAIAMAAAAVFILNFAGTYRRRIRIGPSPVLFVALAGAMLVASSTSLFSGEYAYSPALVMAFLPVALILVSALRLIYDRFLKKAWQADSARKNVLIVGATSSGRRIAKALKKQPAYYRLVGFIDDSTDDGADSDSDILANVSSLGVVIDEMSIDEVMICLPNESDRVLDAIGVCMRRKVAWRAVPNMYGLRLDRVSIDSFGGVPLVGSQGTQLVGIHRIQKRTFDIVIASIALVVISPILLVVATAVRLTSRGPVLYKQTRVGIDGRTFTMLKFRSMKTGSSTDIHSDYTREWILGRTGSAVETGGDVAVATLEEAPAEVHKMSHDPRITAIGLVLRAASLDELPQFWNVLRGDMSVVGPRPALPYEVERYTEAHKRRLAVPPGITGAWQVSGRSELSFEQMVGLDVNYIENWSLTRDFAILVRTVPAILKFGGK